MNSVLFDKLREDTINAFREFLTNEFREINSKDDGMQFVDDMIMLFTRELSIQFAAFIAGDRKTQVELRKIAYSKFNDLTVSRN